MPNARSRMKRREDSIANAKIRVVHVRRLDGLPPCPGRCGEMLLRPWSSISLAANVDANASRACS